MDTAEDKTKVEEDRRSQARPQNNQQNHQKKSGGKSTYSKEIAALRKRIVALEQAQVETEVTEKRITALEENARSVDEQLDFILAQVNVELNKMNQSRQEMIDAAEKAALHRLDTIVSEERGLAHVEPITSEADLPWYKDPGTQKVVGTTVLCTAAASGVVGYGVYAYNKKQKERELQQVG